MLNSVQLAQSDGEIARCFAVMLQLRPHLKEDTFIPTVRDMMNEGYQLAYIKEGEQVVAAAGFRLAKSLYMGKHLYVDDLITDENCRSSGNGHALITWLTEFAKINHCAHIHLDSGVQRHRAHRFYLNQGMDIVCYHFDKVIS